MSRPTAEPEPDGREDPVYVHLHLAVTGTFPLRVADLLFGADELVIPEYEYLTPLFGIARGRMGEVSDTARKRYDEEGVDGLTDAAQRTHRVPYGRVERVRVYDDSGIGRPKVSVDVTAGPPYAYRIHAPVAVESLTDALCSLGRHKGFDVETSSALGFSPVTSVRRFLADR